MSRLPGGKPAPPLRSEATRLLGHMGGGQIGQHDSTMTLQLRGKRQQPHQAKQMYNSLQRHSTSGGGGGLASSSSRSKTSDAIDVDYENVDDCIGIIGRGIGGGAMGGNG